MTKDLICDFCSEPVPDRRWRYRLRDDNSIVAGAPGIVWVAEGDWCACDECKPIIESGDRKALTARSLEMLVGVEDVPAVYEQEVGRLHEVFMRAKISPPGLETE